MTAYFIRNEKTYRKTPAPWGSYPNSFNHAWANIKQRPSNFAVGLNVSVPILDWGRNRRLVRVAEARQIQYVLAKEDQHRQIETEVRALVAQIQSYLSWLVLLEKNMALAEERRRLNSAYDNT